MKQKLQRMIKTTCRASLTVEAAVAIGIFCLCMGCILLFFPFLEKEIVNIQVMYEVCGEAEAASALESELTEEAVLADSYLKWSARCSSHELLYYAAEEEGGSVFSGEYQMPMPFSVLSQRMIFLHTMYIRHWTGYDRSSGQAGEMVYITKTGEVYHRTIQCHHLQVSIREVEYKNVGKYRNRSGGKYYPCEHCVKNSCGEKVFITTEGDRYHSIRSCSSLLRFIQKVEKSTVEATHRPCKTCYGQEKKE